jgi:hypothetical protein
MTIGKIVAVCTLAVLLSWGLPAVGDSVYTYKAPSRDGIGKVYLGREIARVMGHQGAAWLERPSRPPGITKNGTMGTGAHS